ncbi:MAG TPA: YdeI/OmpD-associated family protein [Phenylobacterium sp.]|nr:YdeI/OmpD-associated family protein [Phenylobacterium sp.]
MKFAATVVPSGNATAVEVPAEAMKALGPQARPPIVVTINGHSWRSRIALMRGQILVGISAENRAGAGISEGETVEVDLELDEAPREVAEPADLAAALDAAAGARAAFVRLPFGLKRKYVAEIEQAKSDETRLRRINKLVATLSEPRAPTSGR